MKKEDKGKVVEGDINIEGKDKSGKNESVKEKVEEEVGEIKESSDGVADEISPELLAKLREMSFDRGGLKAKDISGAPVLENQGGSQGGLEGMLPVASSRRSSHDDDDEGVKYGAKYVEKDNKQYSEVPKAGFEVEPMRPDRIDVMDVGHKQTSVLDRGVDFVNPEASRMGNKLEQDYVAAEKIDIQEAGRDSPTKVREYKIQ